MPQNEPSAEAVASGHIAALRKLKGSIPDYDGSDPRARHYQAIRAAIEAGIEAITAPIDLDARLREARRKALEDTQQRCRYMWKHNSDSLETDSDYANGFEAACGALELTFGDMIRALSEGTEHAPE